MDVEEQKKLIKEALHNIEVKAEVQGQTDMYTTIGEAEARAEQLGGQGYHAHSIDGETVYMPFNSHREYLEAVGDNKQEISDRLKTALKKKSWRS